MRNSLLFLLLSVLFCVNGYAQNTYGNEWIDYNKTYFKFPIIEEGLYRIHYDALQNIGLDDDVNNLQLFFGGEQVPIFISDESGFDNDDFIEFYADKLDGSFDTQLFEEPEDQLHTFKSLFSDTAYYFLTTDLIGPFERVEEVENDLNNTPTPTEYFIHSYIYFADQFFFQGISHRYNGVNINLPLFEEGEGFIGDVFANGIPNISNSKEIFAYTPNVFDNGPNTNIKLKVVGLSDDIFVSPDHTLQVKINGTEIVNDDFDGYDVRKYNIDNYPTNYLSSPFSTAQFSALNFSSALERNAISYLQIDYPRTFDFEVVPEKFSFNIESNSNSTDYLQIVNFEAASTLPLLYDLTNNQRYGGIVDSGILHFHLNSVGSSNRALYLTQQNETYIKSIDELQVLNFVDYNNIGNQGNYILITHPKLNNGLNNVDAYAAYRSNTIGGSFETTIVYVNELYDQFSFGIKKHPLAIKNFINFTLENWNQIPEYTFLVGKAIDYSLCYFDEKNWNDNLVPSYGNYPSDQIFSDDTTFMNQRLAIGRISANDQQEVGDYLNKVILYENELFDCSNTLANSWHSNVLHINGYDLNNTAIPIFFDNLSSTISLPPYNSEITTMEENNSILSCNGLPAYDCMEEQMTNGIGILTYIENDFSTFEFTFNTGLGTIDQNNQFPFFFGIERQVGNIYRSLADEAAAETWVKYPNYGFIGSFGSSYVVFPEKNLFFELYQQINYNPISLSIGNQFNNAINNTIDNSELVTSYMVTNVSLNADPAIRLYPNPQPNYTISSYDLSATYYISDNLMNIEFTAINEGLTQSEIFDITIQIQDESGMIVETVTESVQLPAIENFSYQIPINLDATMSYIAFINIDSSNDISESCEDDNEIQITVNATLVASVINEDFEAISINNFPNPFNQQTTFNLNGFNQTGYIEIYSINGESLKQLKFEQNSTALVWDGKDEFGNIVPTGIYTYSLFDENGISLSNKNKLIKF